jgi:hypothetical protein
MLNADYLILPSGRKVYRVQKAKYLRCEKIRNYILRNHYERGTEIWLLKFKAMSKFRANEQSINQALYNWKNWYYDAGVRHRPIEAFIRDHEKELQTPKVVIVNG